MATHDLSGTSRDLDGAGDSPRLLALAWNYVFVRFPSRYLSTLNWLVFCLICGIIGAWIGSKQLDSRSDIEKINYHQTQIEKIKAKYEREAN